jgi:serine/threonine-protein kinase
MRWAAIIAVAALIAGAILGGAYWYAKVRVPTYPVPVLKGLTVDKVDALISGTGWEVQKVPQYRDGTDEGEILAQYPEPYTEVARNGKISIEVSKGPTLVDVPTTLPGKPLATATEMLEKVGLRAKVVERRPDENAGAEQVISFAKDTPSQIPKGREVGLIVSNGPEPRTVPAGLENLPVDQAAAALTGIQLRVGRADDFSETVPAGAVIKVDPGAGTKIERGQTVTLTVSKGKNVVKVPQVVGKGLGEAVATLRAAGLAVDVAPGGIPLVVKSTDPAGGTDVPPGTKVTITAGAF